MNNSPINQSNSKNAFIIGQSAAATAMTAGAIGQVITKVSGDNTGHTATDSYTEQAAPNKHEVMQAGGPSHKEVEMGLWAMVGVSIFVVIGLFAFRGRK